MLSQSMERWVQLWEVVLMLFIFMSYYSSATLSPTGVNYEVVALMGIKGGLKDPYNVLDSWDMNSVDPCSWRMITCSSDGYVSALGLPGQSLIGTLSPAIGNLSNLESVLLQNNAIYGSIPSSIGMLEKLQTLDLSNNKFDGEIPTSLGDLQVLNYLRLNNNSITGQIPDSLSKLNGLTLIDLSFNNLSGSLPKLSARTFKFVGNPLMCGQSPGNDCSSVYPEPLSFPPDNLKDQPKTGSRNRQVGIAIGVSFGATILAIVVVTLLVWRRYNLNKQIFFDVNDQYEPEIRLGHLRRHTFKELRSATDHFSSKNILGQGGYGIVYKGRLSDGAVVAVKRLKDFNTLFGEIQFQTEVETISLAVHRNLLRLSGFCSTENERLLVYPYMSNGSVAARLKDNINGMPILDWTRRKKIALGTARGLVYLHEQSDPKIIHRDVKAANILLDDDFEAVVGDFGLAKLLDHKESHVTTAVRGTVGHIAPEYLSTGQSSEKTDVFGYGVLLLELITGLKALEFGRGDKQKGIMLDWVKKVHEEGNLEVMVDKDIINNLDKVELEEMVQVALLCTQFNPCQRPKMSEVLRMLEGDGLAEKWAASQTVETPNYRAFENLPPRYHDYIEDSSLIAEAMELSGPR